jgi:lycopene cyclase CruP
MHVCQLQRPELHNVTKCRHAEPSRPSLERMLEDYWHMMPEYQGVPLDSLKPHRILYGFFPTYRDSPLKPQFDRILAVGDSSGIQSPLSFGGFGALTRHIERLTVAITEAIEVKLHTLSHVPAV